VRLEGSLDAFGLPDIFSLLSSTKKTGGLHLRRSGEHGVVWFSDGLITGGASNLSRLSLGRRIAGSGLVADSQLSTAVNEVTRSSDIGLARALHDAHALDEGELQTVVCEHVVDTVFDLMRWPEGVFEFVIDEPNVDDVGVARDTAEVVTEAQKRLGAWEAIDEPIAAATTVLSLALDLDADPLLDRSEWELVALIDGRRTVGDLVNICGRGEYAVVVALAELVGRGLIRTNNSEGVAAMLRRQQLVSSLETDAVVDEPMARTARPDAEVSNIASRSRTTASAEPVAVTPQRPEPFLPEREPDHPEPLAAAVAGGGVVASAAPVPAGAIERDPNVNKSLVLRLIAGVRGL
jgi:Domain of unknown function (DUF4388)